LTWVADENEDLLIMSSHGRSGIRPWALGSVIVKVFHESACPILVTRPDLMLAWSIETPVLKKILIPLDGSDVSLAALPFVKELARSLDASLILVNVILDSVFMPLASEFVVQQTGWAEQFLEKVAEETRASGLDVSTRVVAGVGVVDAIIRAAEESKADLIALSTHGRSGLARWPIGSVADGVAHRASLPCLLVRPPGIQKPA
jgi:nucleotide-binding universal stress UspA family protein